MRKYIGLCTLVLFAACAVLPGSETLSEPEAANHQLINRIMAMPDEESEALRLFLMLKPGQLAAGDAARYRTLRKRFAVITLSLQKLGLSDTGVSAMAVDHEDLWAGDWLGSLVRYNIISGERFVLREGRPSTQITAVSTVYIEETRVWAVAGDGVLSYNKQTGEIVFYPKPSENGYPQSIVRYKNQLLLGTSDGGLWALEKGAFHQSPLSSGLPAAVYAFAFWQDTLWAGSEEGLWFYRDACWNRFTAIPPVPVNFLVADGERLWAGTSGAGLFCYTAVSQQTAHFSLADNWVKSGAAVASLFYAGTLGAGLVKIEGGTVTAPKEPLPPALLRIQALTYFEPYLVVGALGNAVTLVHKSLL
jgi:ligand-binding sensor domain-containing protein